MDPPVLQATGAQTQPEDLGNELLQGVILLGEMGVEDGVTDQTLSNTTLGAANAHWLESLEWP